METHKINAKFYLNGGVEVDYERWYRAFDRWIPATPDEVLIDVADYRHVGRGPLALLVGHEANYALDNTDGRPGLEYCRKQPLEGAFQDRLRAVLRAALKACRRLEEDEALGEVRFRGDEVRLTVNDRLAAPNTPEVREALEPLLKEQLEALFGGSDVRIDHDDDPRHLLSVTVSSERNLSVSDLLENLDDSV